MNDLKWDPEMLGGHNVYVCVHGGCSNVNIHGLNAHGQKKSDLDGSFSPLFSPRVHTRGVWMWRRMKKL